MNFTVAPPRSPLTSLVYISKPLTMSLPTWANGPVIGAMNPMRNSSAAKPEVSSRLIPKVRHAPISIGPAPLANLLVNLLVMVLHSVFASLRSRLDPMRRSLRRGHQILRQSRCGGERTALANSLRNAHQAARKVKNCQHVDSAQHVLPPRHQ